MPPSSLSAEQYDALVQDLAGVLLTADRQQSRVGSRVGSRAPSVTPSVARGGFGKGGFEEDGYMNAMFLGASQRTKRKNRNRKKKQQQNGNNGSHPDRNNNHETKTMSPEEVTKLVERSLMEVQARNEGKRVVRNSEGKQVVSAAKPPFRVSNKPGDLKKQLQAIYPNTCLINKFGPSNATLKDQIEKALRGEETDDIDFCGPINVMRYLKKKYSGSKSEVLNAHKIAGDGDWTFRTESVMDWDIAFKEAPEGPRHIIHLRNSRTELEAGGGWIMYTKLTIDKGEKHLPLPSAENQAKHHQHAYEIPTGPPSDRRMQSDVDAVASKAAVKLSGW